MCYIVYFYKTVRAGKHYSRLTAEVIEFPLLLANNRFDKYLS